jgi:hypothetical protein
LFHLPQMTCFEWMPMFSLPEDDSWHVARHGPNRLFPCTRTKAAMRFGSFYLYRQMKN